MSHEPKNKVKIKQPTPLAQAGVRLPDYPVVRKRNTLKCLNCGEGFKLILRKKYIEKDFYKGIKKSLEFVKIHKDCKKAI